MYENVIIHVYSEKDTWPKLNVSKLFFIAVETNCAVDKAIIFNHSSKHSVIVYEYLNVYKNNSVALRQ